MEIVDEGALDKALEGPGRTLDEKIWNKIYKIIDDKYSKQ